MAGHVTHRFHQAARSAAVEVRSFGLFQYRPEIVGPIGVAMIVMDDDLASVLRPAQLFAKGGHLGAAAEVIQLERTPARAPEVTEHGKDGRDPDAAGDK